VKESYGQIENRWLPDSIYATNKVRTVYVYLNSPKDLSEIIEIDKYGRITKTSKYNASYNRKTRNRKCIEDVVNYKYIKGILIETNNQTNTYKTLYNYSEEGKLISKEQIRNGYRSYYTTCQHDPYSETTTLIKDSIIMFSVTKTYDKDHYVNGSFGYSLNPTLRKDSSYLDRELHISQYSDYNDLVRYNQQKSIDNEFNKGGQLIRSKVHSRFMNDRIKEYTLTYKYHRNGLLKSIRGYVPRFFKYDYYE